MEDKYEFDPIERKLLNFEERLNNIEFNINKAMKYKIEVIVKELFFEKFEQNIREQTALMLLEIRKRTFKIIENAVKPSVINELKHIDVPLILKQRIDGLYENKFEDIINKCISKSYSHISKSINKQLRQVVTLKTSTIQEITTSIDNQAQSEEKVLQMLSNDFPEYYKEIQKEQIMKIDIDNPGGKNDRAK